MRVGAALLLILLGGPFQSAHAQDLTDLISQCGGSSMPGVSVCQRAALRAQAAQGALGLAASGGAALPGSASTLGWRTKGSPRFALTGWGTLTRSTLPAGITPWSSQVQETTVALPAIHLSGTIGLFDGFSLGPTAGGFGSIDLMGSAQWVHTPEEEGFDENNVGWGAGVRLGILRESFTLPGISLSGFYRSLGSVTLGDLTQGDPVQVGFDLEVTSLRGIVGKDLWGIGFYGGAGWDRYGAETGLLVSDPEGGELPLTGSGEIESERRLFFFGASRTFIALQISVEGGWAQGFDPDRPLSLPQGFDPTTGSEFGALSFRVTF